MVNTPIPHSLRSESRKAAKILQDFTMPSAKSGPDKIIPAGILVNAEGLAILTVVKIGFLVTARGGSGIVIAKLGHGKWSAPSAIGIAGLGGGFEIGAEFTEESLATGAASRTICGVGCDCGRIKVTDFVIILTRKSAVEAFSKGGNLTLGGNVTVAAGPLGRNVEGDVAVRSPAAVYTYSKTKGLFAGISIEGSYLVERKEANRKFYGRDVRAYEILAGSVDSGNQCEELYSVLGHHEAMFERVLEAKTRQAATRGVHTTRSEMRPFSKESHTRSSQRSSKVEQASSDPYNSSYKGSWADKEVRDDDDYVSHTSRSAPTRRASASTPKPATAIPATGGSYKHSTSSHAGRSRINSASADITPANRASISMESEWNKPLMCKALWSYKGQLPCDLSFKAGDVIEIRTRTRTQDDWWEGVGVDGKLGIFPANYVELL